MQRIFLNLLALVLILVLFSCEKDADGNPVSYCPDLYIPTYSVTGEIKLNNQLYATNQFYLEQIDSTWSFITVKGNYSMAYTALGFYNMKLNDTLFNQTNPLIANLVIAQGDCDAVLPCTWNEGSDPTNWTLLQEISTDNYSFECNVKAYKFLLSADDCELFNGISDSINITANLQLTKL